MNRYILLLTLMYQVALAQISPNLLAKLEINQKVPVLIQFKDKADLSQLNPAWSKVQKTNYVYSQLASHASSSQTAVISYLKDNKIEFRSFNIVNVIQAELNKIQVETLSKFKKIALISYDSPTPAISAQDQSLSLMQRGPAITWGIQRVGADKVWDLGYQGQGVIVGGEDTGIKWDIPAIKEKYRGFQNGNIDHNYNWHDAIHAISPLSGNPNNPCGLDLKEPCDDNSHGTHTIGTMVGQTPEQAIGMAPLAQWIGCRNMEQGNGAPSTYIECFNFFLAPTDLNDKNPKPELAPHVINNSWYCSLEEGCDPSNYSIMEEVIENLKAAGIVVVVSAGNDGAACNTLRHPPAIYDASFSVGAFEENNTISDFSSNGPVNNYKEVRIKPNVVAPGSNILSMLPDGTYAAWNGTSMAGPHVAGLVALMISANPLLAGQVQRIEKIIEETAERFTADFDCFPYTGLNLPNNTYGFGLINAVAAIEKALLVVDIDQETKSTFELFPNPANAEIEIKHSFPNNTLIQIKDVNGKLMLQNNLKANTSKIHIEHLLPGVYFISNTSNHQVISFIKM
ncbi:MAG: S8 family serine peptidase [Saprospiraceae bacterium]|nr:S8 family serine peptidase [Saprospiraceae bacterium]